MKFLLVGALGLFVAMGQALASSAAETPRISRATVTAAVVRLEKLAEESLQKLRIPGLAMAVIHEDEVVFLKGFGVREVGQPAAIDPDTVFQLASVSKPITSSILAILVGQGTVHWDDRVIDHDPGFRLFNAETTRELRLRDLLCHRSGLPDHAGDLLEDLGYDRQEILFRLRYLQPDSSFRTGYAYTNFGYTEAAVAAARAVGQPWEDLAAELLFQPLGMPTASFKFADFARHENRARLHVPEGDRWQSKYVRQPDAQSPAGGANMSLRDLTRWMQLQLGKGQFEGRQIVSAEALADTHYPQIVNVYAPVDGRMVSYALGWNTSMERGGRTFWRHSGAFSLGVRTEVAFLPEENLAIAVLVNAAPTGLPEGLTESFYDFVLAGELSRDWIEFANRMFAADIEREAGRLTDFRQRPAQPAAPLELGAYVGEYENVYFGKLTIAMVNDALALKLGPQQTPHKLQHWDRDLFYYQPVGESATGPTGVRFAIAANGCAAQLLVEYLDADGQGTFTRVPAK